MRVPSCVMAIAAIALGPAAWAESDEEALLRLHAKAIQAHAENSVDLLQEDEGEPYVVASRGEVMWPTLAERRERMGPYLESTVFEVYRDVEEPIVKVSADGTLGWVIAVVHARGTRTGGDGAAQTLEFTSAWIELYEKKDGRWLRVGNVSNFKQ